VIRAMNILAPHRPLGHRHFPRNSHRSTSNTRLTGALISRIMTRMSYVRFGEMRISFVSHPNFRNLVDSTCRYQELQGGESDCPIPTTRSFGQVERHGARFRDRVTITQPSGSASISSTALLIKDCVPRNGAYIDVLSCFRSFEWILLSQTLLLDYSGHILLRTSSVYPERSGCFYGYIRCRI